MFRTLTHLLHPAPLLILSLLLSAPFANASTVSHSRADQAMAEGNYAQAYCILQPLAQQGDPKAQHDLGWMYSNGYGLAVNESKALIWWRKAARQEHGNAQFALAMAYLSGEGVKKNDGEAVKWLLQAAANGIEDAIPIIRSRAARGSEAAKSAIQDLIRTSPDLLGTPATVKVPRANIRTAGNKEADLLATLKQGDALVHFADNGNWAQIGIVGSGQVGWVYKPLISIDTENADGAASR